MPDDDHPTDGWADSLRRTGSSLLGMAEVRLELFAVELQEEKLRTLNAIVWLVVALALLVAGLLVALASLAVYLWTVAGFVGLVSLALATLGAGAGILQVFRHRIRHGPTPFAETIGEFRKDRACLHRDN